jgi:hypothetical protein
MLAEGSTSMFVQAQQQHRQELSKLQDKLAICTEALQHKDSEQQSMTADYQAACVRVCLFTVSQASLLPPDTHFIHICICSLGTAAVSSVC